jgi:dephospho-CoA kinase
MLKVGLTGAIASGKSVVGEMLVEQGAHLVQADRIAHALMSPGQAVYNQVVGHFGVAILNSDLTVNRARLAEAVFGTAAAPTPSRVEELNRIVHPAVLRSQQDWMEEMGRQDPRAIAIVEAALILEAGAAWQFDCLIVVTCSAEQRVARFAARQKIGIEAARSEVERRMAAQLPEAEKVKAADYIVDNSGPLAHTQSQVSQIWRKLRARNP